MACPETRTSEGFEMQVGNHDHHYDKGRLGCFFSTHSKTVLDKKEEEDILPNINMVVGP